MTRQHIVFKVGDRVRVRENCPFQFYRGKVGTVVQLNVVQPEEDETVILLDGRKTKTVIKTMYLAEGEDHGNV